MSEEYTMLCPTCGGLPVDSHELNAARLENLRLTELVKVCEINQREDVAEHQRLRVENDRLAEQVRAADIVHIRLRAALREAIAELSDAQLLDGIGECAVEIKAVRAKLAAHLVTP